jgi:hypothetical protein
MPRSRIGPESFQGAPALFLSLEGACQEVASSPISISSSVITYRIAYVTLVPKLNYGR